MDASPDSGSMQKLTLLKIFFMEAQAGGSPWLRFASMQLAQLRSAELRTAQLRSAEFEDRPAEIRPYKARPAKVRHLAARLAEVCRAEIRSAGARRDECPVAEVHSAKVRPAEVRVYEDRPAEVGNYFRVLLSPIVPYGYSLVNNLKVFFACYRVLRTFYKPTVLLLLGYNNQGLAKAQTFLD
jgi:hypothetical protein